MTTFIQQNPLAALIVFGVIVLGLAAVIAVLAVRAGEKRQQRLIHRLRKDAAQRDRALLRMAENMGGMSQQIDTLSGAMEERQDRLRRTLDERMDQLNQSNERRLEQMRQTVSEKLDDRLGESFKVVNSQLAGVHRGLGEMRELAMGVNDLTRLLGGVKTRGVWGEVQLRALLSQMFAPEQYVENAAIPEGSQTRVEFALRMPAADGESLLPIDSKFPREDYLRLIEAAEAGDQEKVRRCGAMLERAVLEQARLIHDKYIRPPQTTDFAVMFLPTESLYAEVARRDGLVQRMQERWRVLAAGPATLCALLTSLQMGLRTLSLEQRSGEVLGMLAAMKQDFDQFDESIQRMRQRLTQAEAELNTLETRSRKVLRALDGMDR